MLKRLLLPAAAGVAIYGAAALVPAPASAHWAGTHQTAQGASDVIQVQRAHRNRGWHGHRNHHRHWHYARPYHYAPYAFAPRRCGYVWSPRYHRHIYRCW